ncbi:hypothetical protein IAE19_03235 [Acinetobacter sp. S40]|uniref:hypothetical protein n=1 Tax=Acinetobacter sp. S40 TaxID=2767434 RepID=UPI00190E2CBB|nr:hypothetical protein [Acinetobacter sp. S40]MBJ9984453.1 hypothetical protein [Acinetobacter sp. S40]
MIEKVKIPIRLDKLDGSQKDKMKEILETLGYVSGSIDVGSYTVFYLYVDMRSENIINILEKFPGGAEGLKKYIKSTLRLLGYTSY